MKARSAAFVALLTLWSPGARSAAAVDDSILSGTTAGQAPAESGKPASAGVPPQVFLPDPGTCVGAPQESGTVGLRIHVDRRGVGDQVLVIGSSGSATLDVAAVAYVKAKWRYSPGVLGGRPAGAWLAARLTFDGKPPNCPLLTPGSGGPDESPIEAPE